MWIFRLGNSLLKSTIDAKTIKTLKILTMNSHYINKMLAVVNSKLYDIKQQYILLLQQKINMYNRKPAAKELKKLYNLHTDQ